MATTVKTFRQRLLENPKVVEAAKAAKAGQEKYQYEIEQLSDLMFPKAKAERLRIAMGQMKSPSEIEMCKTQIFECESPAANHAAARAKAISNEHRAAFRPLVSQLIDAGEAAAAEFRSEVKQAETEFFSRFGLPRKETEVMAAVLHIENDVRHFRGIFEDDFKYRNVSAEKNYMAVVLDYFEA